MNTTETLHGVSMLRSPLLCTKRIPTKPPGLIGLYRLNQGRFASTGSRLSGASDMVSPTSEESSHSSTFALFHLGCT